MRIKLEAAEVLRLKDAQLVAQDAEMRLHLAQKDLDAARAALAGVTGELLAKRRKKLPKSAAVGFKVSGPDVHLVAGKMQEPGGKTP